MWKLTLAVAIVAALPLLSELLLRREFPTFARGGVVISGASSGIGRDVAARLADLGYVVFAGVRSDKDAAELRGVSPQMQPILLDVADASSVTRAVEQVMTKLKEADLPLVGVVNNAGISIPSPIETSRMEDVERVTDVNYFGVWRLTIALLPHLRHSKGRVVIVGSLNGFMSPAFFGAYSATKAALESFSDCLRREVLEHGVSVSLVRPGAVLSKIADHQLRVFEHLSAQDTIYQRPLQFMEQGVRGSFAQTSTPADTTTPAITHALLDPYPRTRYETSQVQGLPVWLIKWLMWVLPDRLGDLLVMSGAEW